MFKGLSAFIIVLLDRYDKTDNEEGLTVIYIVGMIITLTLGWVFLEYTLSIPVDILKVFYPPAIEPCDCK
tara:strand:- start:6725 stop:6934 length:210 start_codon:yes stop_codon:yes gene_type:complete